VECPAACEVPAEGAQQHDRDEKGEPDDDRLCDKGELGGRGRLRHGHDRLVDVDRHHGAIRADGQLRLLVHERHEHRHVLAGGDLDEAGDGGPEHRDRAEGAEHDGEVHADPVGPAQ
jgi:hypothetical protein